MTVVFVVLGALVIFAIAAAFVGSEAFRLGHETPAAIFDLDEAVDAIGDDLSEGAQARLTYEEVRALVVATLGHLQAKGLLGLPGEDLDLTGSRPEVVVAEDDALAVVLGAVDGQGLDVADEDAVEVIGALLAHLERIGALGPRA